MSKNTHEATLVRGRVYTLLIPNESAPTKPTAITFENGVPKAVTKAVYDRLREQAVEEVSVGSGGQRSTEGRSKFEFHPVGTAAAAAAEDDDTTAEQPQTRQRTKPAQ